MVELDDLVSCFQSCNSMILWFSVLRDSKLGCYIETGTSEERTHFWNYKGKYKIIS